jgi:hypothetical protein
VRLPELAGIGAVPVICANCAANANRCAPAVSPIALCRGQRPAARHREQRGSVRGDTLGELGLEGVDRDRELADAREFVAGDPDLRGRRIASRTAAVRVCQLASVNRREDLRR